MKYLVKPHGSTSTKDVSPHSVWAGSNRTPLARFSATIYFLKTQIAIVIKYLIRRRRHEAAVISHLPKSINYSRRIEQYCLLIPEPTAMVSEDFD